MPVLRRGYAMTFLPDDSLSAHTEFAFIGAGGMPFVNAAKHEEVVARHVAEVERLREALRHIASSPVNVPSIHCVEIAMRALGMDSAADSMGTAESFPP